MLAALAREAEGFALLRYNTGSVSTEAWPGAWYTRMVAF